MSKHVVKSGIAVAVIATFAMVGCGGNDGEPAAGSGATATTPVSTPTASARSAVPTGPTVTLRIGTDDEPGRPAANAIEDFARQVDELSGGTLRIEPVFEANGGDVDDWDQAVARMVVAGELEMGVIPARAWDTEGVTTLRALHAPFLVTSDALVAEIVTDEVLADEMLAGLGEIGITGLALLPEELRHLFAFGDPLLAPDDFVGKTIRAPRSDTTYALFEALGATPDDLADPEGPRFETAVADGIVAAAESGFAVASNLPGATTVFGNVTLFPKVNSLVVNTDAFEELSGAEQTVLRDAARRTLDWVVSATVPDYETAERYCEGDGTVLEAGESDIQTLEESAQTVYAELERDAATRDQIARIRQLRAKLAAPTVVSACDPARSADAEPATNDDQGALDGVYEYELTQEYLVGSGFTERQALEESGVHTVTMTDGEFSDTGPNGSCSGRYTIAGDVVTFEWLSKCEGDWSATVTVDGDRLLWTDVRSLPPFDDLESQRINETFAGVPWVNVAEVG